MGDNGEVCSQPATTDPKGFTAETDRQELLVSADISVAGNDEDELTQFIEEILDDITLSIQRISEGEIIVWGYNEIVSLDSAILRHDSCNYKLDDGILMEDSPFSGFECADMFVRKNVVIAAVLRAANPIQQVRFARPTGAYF